MLRAQMPLAYRENPSFYAMGQKLGVHHQTVQRCVEGALADGPLAVLDGRPRPGKEPTITPETKAWLLSLACDKAKAHGYPHELWTTRLLGAPCARTRASRKACVFGQFGPGNAVQESRPGGNEAAQVRYYLENSDAEFEQKMAEVLCVYHEVQVLKICQGRKAGKAGGDRLGGICRPSLVSTPPLRATRKYTRHCTLSRLAGIDLLTGKVHDVKDRHRSREFIELLRLIDAAYPPNTAIKLILTTIRAGISRETRGLARYPAKRALRAHLHPQARSLLDLIEGFFSKLARSVLATSGGRQIMISRSAAGIDDVNRRPVIHTWSYKLAEAA
ncbi:IS630 family transposase [Bradyrhizobium forestalis]|uniref:IS630 family transposase n=1 Tax=Bradyrhizobium forestalis TaxID=1419263 RepID=A0A2M8QXN7_9BRAD|nr:helix-turn-helix domain-containing protein [Bradyrhizobium forestalis]PJG50348.1 IS630 family transposase [Bradyrhizobium forestalis]